MFGLTKILRVFGLVGVFSFLSSFVSASTPTYYSVDTPLNVFILICIIGVVLFVGGLAARSAILSTVGLVIFSIVGLLMMQNHVLIPTGSVNETLVYGSNFTGVHWDEAHPDDAPVFTPADNTVFLFNTMVEKEYEPWDDGNNLFIGFLIFIASVISIITIGGFLFSRGD